MPKRICNAEPRSPVLLLFARLHDPFGNTLPFAIALHPGIHPNVAPGKLFTILVLAFLRRRAADGGQVRPVDMNIHVVVRRRAQGVGFVFGPIKQLGLGNMFSFGIKSGKVVRYYISDGGRSLLTSALTQASSICLRLAWTALESAAFS